MNPNRHSNRLVIIKIESLENVFQFLSLKTTVNAIIATLVIRPDKAFYSFDLLRLDVTNK